MKKLNKKAVIIGGVVTSVLVVLIATVVVIAVIQSRKAEEERMQKVAIYNKATSEQISELDKVTADFRNSSSELASLFVVPENITGDSNYQLSTIFSPDQFELTLRVHESRLETVIDQHEKAKRIKRVEYKETAETNKKLDSSIQSADEVVEKYSSIYEYYRLIFPIQREYLKEIETAPRTNERQEEEDYRAKVDDKVYKYEQLKSSALSINVPDYLSKEHENFIKLVENRQGFVNQLAEEQLILYREIKPVYKAYSPINSTAKSIKYEKAILPIRTRHAATWTASKTVNEADRQAYIAIIESRKAMFTESVDAVENSENE